MEIPILSNMIEGLGVFFKTRRYVAYLIVFVVTTFLGLFFGWILTGSVGTGYEEILVNVFVYVGATGTIYFALGTLFTAIGADSLWITRRGRGRVTELKGAAWMAVSFALAVFLSVLVGRSALYFFAVFCWLGWIAFQAFLSSRTSLRVATIAEPKKGGVAIGIGSFIILIIGIGIIAVEALAALYLIPNDLFGLGTMIDGMFANASSNIATHYSSLLIAYGMMGLFAFVSLLAFFRYARRGAALNIAILVVFIAIYSGYFLFNVLRRSGPPSLYGSDVVLTLFFLVYAMSGIGTTVTGTVEGSRKRLRDLGPLATFFMASGFFFIDTIISVSAIPGALIGEWFGNSWAVESAVTWVFRDVAKLVAFPLAAIFSMIYYLRTERLERIVERAREEGQTFDPNEVDA
ncbi:MAG: hypothetical protein ACFFEF_16190, partial [Candidatus Thorarchaeota archaeon]